MLKCATGCPHLLNLTLLLIRLAFGLFLLLAGWNKLFHTGVGTFYEKSFLPLKPAWLPEWFAWSYGHAIPVLELLVGAALMLGLLTRLSGLGAACMIGSFTIALIAGGTTPILGPGTIHANLIYISLGLLLTATGAGMWSVDTCLAKSCCRKPDDAAAAK